MARNKLDQMMELPDKGATKTAGANGILARLWRQMLCDLAISGQRFGTLLQEYVLDPRNHVPNNRKDQISVRGNLTKEFTRPHMTWKVFCKAMRFLNIVKIDFSIRAYHGTGKISDHSTTVNFGGRKTTTNFHELMEQPEHNELVQYVPFLDDKNKEN